VASIIIKDVPPYDGEYELDVERAFNSDEWEWITKISGYMPLTIDDGFAGGAPKLFVAFAVVAMERSRRIGVAEVMETAAVLSLAPFDGKSITFVGDVVEDDDVPLALTPTPAELLRTGSRSSVG
jgi:hypothetical protein